MLKGNIKCIDMNCQNCPFAGNTTTTRRICLDFHSSQPLFKGLEIAKKLVNEGLIPLNRYEQYENSLNKEVQENGENN